MSVERLRFGPAPVAALPSHGLMLLVVSVLAGSVIPSDASSEPEKIRPGHSYYSDALAESTHDGLVRTQGPEKNYEEVYQLYTYYEFVYDEEERVIRFREFRRGDVIRAEEYRYDDSGSLTQRVVARPGQEDEVTVVDSAGEAPSPEPQGE